jgi:hypothetical protein
MDFVTVAGAIKVTDAVISLGANKSIYRKIKMIMKRNKEIVILGISGAGKTQFMKSFDVGPISYLREKDKTLAVTSNRKVIHECKVKIWDTPGQAIRKVQRHELLKEVITRKRHIGIINVVCFGYNSMDSPPLENMSEGEIEKFISQKRCEEVQQAEEVKTYYELANVDWIITLISKADIWMKDGLEKVVTHYRNGEYNMKLGMPENHEIIPYCSIIQKYYGNIIPVIDEKEKVDINSQLISALVQFLSARG